MVGALREVGTRETWIGTVILYREYDRRQRHCRRRTARLGLDVHCRLDGAQCDRLIVATAQDDGPSAGCR